MVRSSPIPELLGQAPERPEKEAPPRQPQGHMEPLCPTLTITAPLHLPDAVQGISDEVWEAPIEVHRGQASLKAIPRGHQLGQVAKHILAQATNVQLPCKREWCQQPALLVPTALLGCCHPVTGSPQTSERLITSLTDTANCRFPTNAASSSCLPLPPVCSPPLEAQMPGVAGVGAAGGTHSMFSPTRLILVPSCNQGLSWMRSPTSLPPPLSPSQTLFL